MAASLGTGAGGGIAVLAVVGGFIAIFAIAWIAAFIDLNFGSDSSPSATSAPSREQSADPEAEAQKRAETDAMDKTTYKTLSEREYKFLLKEPESQKGAKYMLYVHVFVYDEGHTGNEWFLADIGPTQGSSSWDFADRAAIYLDDPSIAKDVVAGDLVTLYVEVSGNYTYESEENSVITVPAFTAHMVEVTGSE